MLSPTEQFERIRRYAVDILPEQQLLDQLKKGTPLTVKLGIDPTSSQLHLGHTVVLNLLRLMQTMGHHIVLVIGDFTAMIGDPSGKNVTRPVLSQEDVKHHASSYLAQVGKILDLDNTKVVYNSAWFGDYSAQRLLQLISQQTVAQLLERDDFSKRYQANQPIALHELVYPILQGYDSVELQADIEIGGTDQTFNLMMGRHLQKAYQQSPQSVITLPLLEGLDGEKKMSKSLKNTIDLANTPDNFFGKVMSLSDTMMWRYYRLLSDHTLSDIEALEKACDEGTHHPRDAKHALAHALITRFYDAKQADDAKARFIAQFSAGKLPDNLPEHTLHLTDQDYPMANILKSIGFVQSTSEALRLIKQQAVQLNQQRLQANESLAVDNTKHLIQVGKRRAAYVTLTPKIPVS